MKPRIKDGISVMYRPQGSAFEVSFLVNTTGSVYSFSVNKKCLDVIKMLSGKNTLRQIADKAGVSQVAIRQIVANLDAKGIISLQASHSHSPQLNFFSGFERKGYSRIQFQKRLEQAVVAVIGIGGIGTWVIKGLSLLGVRKFIVADPDIVEKSNLNRQCMYSASDVGHSKLDVLECHLIDAGCPCEITKVRRKISSVKQCQSFFGSPDLVINCADEPSTDRINRIVTDTFYARRIPHILCGGYDGHLGFVGPTIVPNVSPCWYCCEKSIDKHLRVKRYRHLLITDSDKKGGSIAPICATVANFHVMEALKVITGISKPALMSQSIEIDFLTYSMFPRSFTKQPNCKICNQKS